MSTLRKQMEADMVLRGMSERTRESYLAAVAGLAKYYNRSPDQVSEVEVQRYLLHLIEERKLAWSSCNVAVSGLRFVYPHYAQTARGAVRHSARACTAEAAPDSCA